MRRGVVHAFLDCTIRVGGVYSDMYNTHYCFLLSTDKVDSSLDTKKTST